MHILGKDRTITLLDDHDRYKIMEQIQEFYAELYDREQKTVNHTDLKEVPVITQ